MQTTIQIRADTHLPSVKLHAYPILEEGNQSFPGGVYSLGFKSGKDRRSVTIRHEIENAPLIDRIVQEQKAKYACAVSSPISSYRELHQSETPEQLIVWESEDLGAPPLFTPMIVITEEQTIALPKDDTLHEIWHGRKVHLLKGMRLARGPVVQLRSSLHEMLSFVLDESLKPGQFFVEPDENSGFLFRVHVAKNLHEFLRYNKFSDYRKNIVPNIITACLACLQREYSGNNGDSEWRNFRNLEAFENYLHAKDLGNWSDDDFNPEEVSTRLYPHVLPSDVNEDE